MFQVAGTPEGRLGSGTQTPTKCVCVPPGIQQHPTAMLGGVGYMSPLQGLSLGIPGGMSTRIVPGACGDDRKMLTCCLCGDEMCFPPTPGRQEHFQQPRMPQLSHLG